MTNLPTPRTVLVNTKSVASFIAAAAAQHQLDAIIHSHNEEQRDARRNDAAAQQRRLRCAEARAAETPFRWGQDFEIEPDVWEEFDEKYA